MAANRTLTEDHQASGHDVGALNSDRNGRTAVANAQVVARAKGHCLATVNIHRIGQDTALELGEMVFKDGRRHSRLFALVDHVSGVVNSRLGNIGLGANPGQRLLHALHVCNRGVELATDTGKPAGGADRVGGCPCSA